MTLENALAPSTVPRDRVIASLVKYDIQFEERETTDSLRRKLAEFYAKRTLTKSTKSAITPEDPAESVFYLASERVAESDRTS